MEGIFFPLKLFVHQGVKDEELLHKSLDAYQVLTFLNEKDDPHANRL